jgi:4-carboxymuconolactone decarboxylase
VTDSTAIQRPKILPVPTEDLDSRAKQILEHPAVIESKARNVFQTFANNPGLLARWWPFVGKLIAGKLPARTREILILRAALLWDCGYEWGHHVVMGAAAGVDSADVNEIAVGSASTHWSEADSALLNAVDELFDDGRISDQTWSVLACSHDRQQLIELPILVGQYAMLSFLLNSVGVEAEEESPEFGVARKVALTKRSESS